MLLLQFILILVCFDKLLGQRKILYGNVAKPGQFPHLVSIRLRSRTEHSCSGSIISNKHIVSVATCIDVNHPISSNARVVTGTTKLDEGGRFYKYSSSISHSEYNKKTMLHDISIIKVGTNIQFNSATRKICLHLTEIEPYKQVIYSDWGCIECRGLLRVGNELTYADILTVPLKNCSAFWNKEWDITITSASLCTFSLLGQGICKNEMGGSMVYQNSLAGIATPIKTCGSGKFDVFTKVLAHLEFILESMAQLN